MNMSKSRLALGAGVTLVLIAATAAALATEWGNSPARDTKPKRAGSAGTYNRLLQYDTDKDGRITRAEVDAGLAAQFAGADLNADGKLDPLEFQKFNDARRAERKARLDAWRARNGVDAATRPPFDQGRDGLEPIKNTDWDLDGAVSLEEFAGKTRAQAMRADRDGDGVIVKEELSKGRGKKRTPAKN
jgi:EF hand